MRTCLEEADDVVTLTRVLRECIPRDRDGGYYVLDIDLDFFSTKNPFVDMFPRAELRYKPFDGI
ncbi:hypothetical protein B566_EDAN011491, partial [Ephemera danica]